MDLTGKTLGKYHIIEALGSGGMAEVYRGEDRRLDRSVAIKVMHNHLAKSKDFRDRFLREAKAIANLQHPNIVSLIDFDNQEDLVYMVMEFISGETLESFLEKSNGLIPLGDAISITRQLASALQYAHRRNMIHRDVKPANVMFVDDHKERVLLTDFGIARLLDEVSLTSSGTALGTPHYMAPEIVKGSSGDHRSDIYSLGILLYEMVVGEAPYEADTPYGVMIKQANEPLPSPRQRNPELPLEVEAVLLKALAKEPDDRYQSAALLEGDLRMLPDFDSTIPLPASIKDSYIATGPATPTKVDLPSISGALPARANRPEEEEKESPLKRWMPLIGAGVGVAAIAGITLFLLSFFGDDNGQAGNGDPLPSATAAVAAAVVDTATPAPTAEPTDIPPTPTDPPQPTPTETTAPTETPIPLPTEIPLVDFNFQESPFFLCNIDLTTELVGEQFTTNVGIKVNDLAGYPLPNSVYHAWLSDPAEENFIALGPILDDGEFGLLQGNLSTTIEGNLLEGFNRLIFSAEPIDSQPTTPANTVLAGTIDAETFAVQQELLINQIGPGNAQYQIALQHANLVVDSLNQGDLNEARRHAEHVINIVQGENGELFGDLDNDGQAQNPGNGVGVLTYIAAIQAELDLAEPIDPNLSFSFVQGQIDKSLINSTIEVTEALDHALKMFAVDSVDEGLPFANDMVTAVQSGIDGRDFDSDGKIDTFFDEEGGFATLDSLLAEWIEGSFLPDHQLGLQAGEIGSIRVLPGASPENEQIELDIYPVPQTERAETTYVLFLRGIDRESGEDRFLNLGPLELNKFRLSGQIEVASGVLGRYDTFLISVEESTTAADQLSPQDIRYEAAFGPETGGLLTSLLVPEDGAELAIHTQSLAEMELLAEHTLFLIESLQNNDLPLARRHAEHVINILVGELATEFGDVDGNGTTENPSNIGFGVRAYNGLMQTTVGEMNVSAELNPRSRFYTRTVIPNTLGNQATLMTDILDLAFKVLATDTAEEAAPIAQSLSDVNIRLLDGFDLDQNETIDNRGGEAGMRTLNDLLFLLTDRSFINLNQ